MNPNEYFRTLPEVLKVKVTSSNLAISTFFLYSVILSKLITCLDRNSCSLLDLFFYFDFFLPKRILLYSVGYFISELSGFGSFWHFMTNLHNQVSALVWLRPAYLDFIWMKKTSVYTKDWKTPRLVFGWHYILRSKLKLFLWSILIFRTCWVGWTNIKVVQKSWRQANQRNKLIR